MKFGVRESCDVVFREKAPMKVGNKIFYKNEPVIYFDTLKTSTLEGAATTVYAQGGRGNARLMSWDGERTVTFTMEDALISPEGLAILTGAGLIEAGEKIGEDKTHVVYVHATETMSIEDAEVEITGGAITFTNIPLESDKVATDASAYVMLMDGNGNIVSEPFSTDTETSGAKLVFEGEKSLKSTNASSVILPATATVESLKKAGYMLLVDFYEAHTSNAMEINITPDKFGGAFYIEASTLFREQSSQLDLPAEFIIPNARVQSNFTFSMAGSGDPSTFTFTMDAFPDYTRFNRKEKVLASIQVIGGNASQIEMPRDTTHTARSIEDIEDGEKESE